MRQAFDFYETPDPLTRWLFEEVSIEGQCYEPCVGNGAIVRASADAFGAADRQWSTNDLDPSWPAETHWDAAQKDAWFNGGRPDWTITNPPFSCWNEIAQWAIERSRVGVALYLRLSAHEPKKQEFRGWWSKYPPSAVLVCPRFAHQRSKKSGEWSTDSVTCCWTIWGKRQSVQRIVHAPESLIDVLNDYTPTYRRRMDELMAGRIGAPSTEVA